MRAGDLGTSENQAIGRLLSASLFSQITPAWIQARAQTVAREYNRRTPNVPKENCLRARFLGIFRKQTYHSVWKILKNKRNEMYRSIQLPYCVCETAFSQVEAFTRISSQSNDETFIFLYL